MAFLQFIFALMLAAGADDFDKVEVKATPLRESVFMLEGAGGNITALTGPEGTFLVDDDFAPMAEKLIAKLRELKGDSPRFVVNTHFHYDHSGGNEVFGKTATIIAAPAVRERLASEQILWRETHPAEPAHALPSMLVKHEVTVQLNGENIRITHLAAGHTDGDVVVFFNKAKVVSLGDLYFAGMYPIFHSEHKGSFEGFVRNLEHLVKLIPDDALIVPGHGPMSRKPELERYVKMIRATALAVRTAKRKGKTLEQIQKVGLPKEWDEFSHGYLTTDKWLSLVYRSIP